jgi:predicted dehydrogenase
MTRPGVAIVGAGLMGAWHARAARRAGGRIAVVVDADPTRARTLAARHPGARVATGLVAALNHHRVAVVHVCTPLPSHLSLALEAVSAGAHVLIEKPFTESLADARHLLETAESRDVLAVPVHQFLFQSGLRAALTTLPELGTIRLVQVTVCSAGAEHQPDRADAVAAEILPHALSVLQRCFPDALMAAEWSVHRPAGGEWHIHARLAGAAVAIHVSMSGRPPMNEFRLTATGGRLHADFFHGFAFREPPETGRWYKMVRPAYLGLRSLSASTANLARRGARWQPAYPGLNELVAETYRAIREGGASPIAASETLAVATARDRICALVRAGEESPG